MQQEKIRAPEILSRAEQSVHLGFNYITTGDAGKRRQRMMLVSGVLYMLMLAYWSHRTIKINQRKSLNKRSRLDFYHARDSFPHLN